MQRSQCHRPRAGTSLQWRQQRLVLCDVRRWSVTSHVMGLTNRLTCATPSTTRASLNAVLLEVRPVCVTRPGIHIHGLVAVIFRALILVHDPNANGRAQCDAKLGT